VSLGPWRPRDAGCRNETRRALPNASRVAPWRQDLHSPPSGTNFRVRPSCDAKVLDENEETGVRKYRYIRTGPNHYSMALTYAWLASCASSDWRSFQVWMRWFESRGSMWL